jgi:hypothetical protein
MKPSRGAGNAMDPIARACKNDIPHHATHPKEARMAKRSSHQESIIRNYYRNQDAIMLQKLGEMVGDLYLAEGKRRAAIWKRVTAALVNLKIPQAQIDHLLKSDNPTLVANLLEELLKNK